MDRVHKGKVQTGFSHIEILYYLHWDAGDGAIIDIDSEVERLVQLVEDKDNYKIFAKSAGILVVIKALAERRIFPKKCIFAGFPMGWASENKIDFEILFEKFEQLSIPTIFIQKTKDPAASFSDLKSFLESKKMPNATLIEIPGNDHHYGDLELLRKEIID